MKQKGFAPLIILIIIALIGVVGYLGYQNYHLKQTQNPSTSPLPNQTYNWKEYTNTKYNFSFSYPSSWQYLEVPTSKYQTENDEVWLSDSNFPPSQTDARADMVFVLTKTDPSYKWQPQYFNSYTSEDYSLGNIYAKKITGIGKESLYQESVIIAKIGTSYIQILSNKNDESTKYFDQILLTFKFIDQKQADNRNSTTYTCPAVIDCFPDIGTPNPYRSWVNASCPDVKCGSY